MIPQEEINQFIHQETGIHSFQPEDDLLYDIGISGDDFHELMETYSEKYNVDMKNYLWYFHTNEEGSNWGAIIFKAPYERVTHIPVTPTLLCKMANKGYWDQQYPHHELPKRRWDIIFNQTIIIIFILWLFIAYCN